MQMHSLFTSLKIFGIHQGNSASMQHDAYFNISSRVACGGFLMEERDETSFLPHPGISALLGLEPYSEVQTTSLFSGISLPFLERH